MHIGPLERKITIEQPTYTISDDTNDKAITSWSTYKTCWASWMHEQSQEAFEAGQLVAKDIYKWKIRYFDAPDTTSDMRILYDSEYYYLVGNPKELGRKEALQLNTIRRDNGTE